MKDTIAVIGAGISGLVFAREMQAAGASVVVLEKGRGVGGRMATKRIGAAAFDQGAQFFTTRSPEFERLAAEWTALGAVAPWPGSAHRRSIGTNGMTSVPKVLGEGLKIMREHKVTRVRRHSGGSWEVEIEEHGVMRAERLVLTAPVPQSLALLEAGDVALPEETRTGLAALRYDPCLALLVVLSGESAVPADGVALESGSIRWIADNTKKGISPGVAAALTIHASPEFSALHYGKTEAEVTALLLPAAERFLGAPVVSATLHRWKFSEPRVTHAERCVWLDDLALGFAGDAFGGPRVEGAVLSGLALAGRVKPTLRALPGNER